MEDWNLTTYNRFCSLMRMLDWQTPELTAFSHVIVTALRHEDFDLAESVSQLFFSSDAYHSLEELD